MLSGWIFMVGKTKGTLFKMSKNSRKAAEETKRHIMQTALDLFFRQGVPGVTLAEIARESGFTRGAIYCHFSSKSQMLQEMVKSSSDHLFEEIEKAIVPEKTPLDNLFNVSYSLFKKIEENPDLALLVKVLFYSIHLFEEPGLRNAMESLFEKRNEINRSLLVKAIETGEIDKDTDIELVCCCLTSFNQGLLMDWIMDQNSPTSGKRKFSTLYVSDALSLFLDGFRKHS